MASCADAGKAVTASASVTSISPPTTISGAYSPWSPDSWRHKPIVQAVEYEDQEAVKAALTKLEHLPPLVTPLEIWKLRNALRDVALGKSFLLQGGDCAELFEYCHDDSIDSKIKLLLQMSLVLIWGGNKPVVRIARMAGQYAKPRSKPTEMHAGQEIPSYRGDILNSFHPDHRKIDPDRLVQAYFHSAATLNYVRAQLSSGIADLHHPMDWSLGHVGDHELLEKYSRIVNTIRESLRFMKTIGADAASGLSSVDLFTSHEALLLAYEEALTRKLKRPSNAVRHTTKRHPALDAKSSLQEATGYYNTSAHLIWIGDRTRQPDHAHVEYARGLENPIGIKVGPTTPPEDLAILLDTVNPNREVGKVMLITRYGKDKIADMLPKHIDAVQKTGHVVVWQCDPMHGNTRSTADGTKTRSFQHVFEELASAIHIHRQQGTYLGGVHLELTSDAVTECTGGSQGIDDADLSKAYRTFCDPRLNEKQALELAFLVADSLRDSVAPDEGL